MTFPTPLPSDRAALATLWREQRVGAYGIHLDTWLIDPAAIVRWLEGDEYRPPLLAQRLVARRWEADAERRASPYCPTRAAIEAARQRRAVAAIARATAATPGRNQLLREADGRLLQPLHRRSPPALSRTGGHRPEVCDVDR